MTGFCASVSGVLPLPFAPPPFAVGNILLPFPPIRSAQTPFTELCSVFCKEIIKNCAFGTSESNPIFLHKKSHIAINMTFLKLFSRDDRI